MEAAVASTWVETVTVTTCGTVFGKVTVRTEVLNKVETALAVTEIVVVDAAIVRVVVAVVVTVEALILRRSEQNA